MKSRTLIVPLLLSQALCAQSTDLPAGVLFISRAVRHVRETLAAAPNYTCLETIDREQLTPPAKSFRRLDVVRLEVAKEGQKELYSWPGGRRFENRPIADFVAGGLVGDGTYGGYADVLFLHDAATMKYQGPEPVRGRPAIRVDYSVSPLLNRINVHTAAGAGEVSYSGSYWVDPDSLDLIRIDIDADEIPFQLQLSRMRMSIEYRMLKTADKSVLLTQSSVLELVKSSGEISRDQMDFTQCREFSSVASMVPDTEETGRTDSATAAAGRAFVLPENLTIPLRLITPVNAEMASVGDALTAMVDGDVKDRQRIWLPKGSLVHGRIRRLEHRRGQPDYVLLGLEFFEVEAGRDTVEFTARLQSLDSFPGLSMEHKESAVVRQLNQPSAPTTFLQTIDFELPGVGYFYLTSAPFRVPANLRMTWRTQALRAAPPR